MIVLGLNDNHDASAALAIDGRIVSAVGQERMDRVKNSAAFPWDAVDDVLRLGGVTPGDVDALVVGSHFTPATALRAAPHQHHALRTRGGQFSRLLDAYIIYQTALRATGAWRAEATASRLLLRRRFRDRGFRATVTTVDHHRAHAIGAAWTTAADPLLVITVDAMGDGTSLTVSVRRGDQLTRLYRQGGLSAIDTYYSRVTEALGFSANRHEGKVTGLAAGAEPPPRLLTLFRRDLHAVGPGFNLRNHARPASPDAGLFRVLQGYSRAEVAAACQTNLERQVQRLVSHWVASSGVRDVAVAGGLFANVRLNMALAALRQVRTLWIYPAMGDGGLAAGAALSIGAARPARLQHVHLGTEIDERACGEAVRRHRLEASRPVDLAGTVAHLLAAGHTVACCRGNMEWGPRALGHRSILVRPDDPSVNDWLNTRLKRSEFMPFAPAVPSEFADRCFEDLGGVSDAARFMTVCAEATPVLRRDCAGVVHLDGTARPQLVHRETSPGLHAILTRFHQLTGLPALINTSFNLHEEPIVRTPDQAIDTWVAARLDHLILGPLLITAPRRQPHPGRRLPHGSDAG